MKTENNKRVLKRVIIISVIIASLMVYLFLYLAIELELKFSIEYTGSKIDSLIDSSFKIRDFATIQLALFVSLAGLCLFLLLRKKKHLN